MIMGVFKNKILLKLYFLITRRQRVSSPQTTHETFIVTERILCSIVQREESIPWFCGVVDGLSSQQRGTTLSSSGPLGL